MSDATTIPDTTIYPEEFKNTYLEKGKIIAHPTRWRPKLSVQMNYEIQLPFRHTSNTMQPFYTNLS